jgi:hypothetical protein
MADDYGHSTTSTLAHDTAPPIIINTSAPVPPLEKINPSRQSTMRSKSGMDVHVSGTATPNSFFGGGNRGSRHMIDFDEYFVSLAFLYCDPPSLFTHYITWSNDRYPIQSPLPLLITQDGTEY